MLTWPQQNTRRVRKILDSYAFSSPEPRINPRLWETLCRRTCAVGFLQPKIGCRYRSRDYVKQKTENKTTPNKDYARDQKYNVFRYLQKDLKTFKSENNVVPIDVELTVTVHYLFFSLCSKFSSKNIKEKMITCA